MSHPPFRADRAEPINDGPHKRVLEVVRLLIRRADLKKENHSLLPHLSLHNFRTRDTRTKSALE